MHCARDAIGLHEPANSVLAGHAHLSPVHARRGRDRCSCLGMADVRRAPAQAIHSMSNEIEEDTKYLCIDAMFLEKKIALRAVSTLVQYAVRKIKGATR